MKESKFELKENLSFNYEDKIKEPKNQENVYNDTYEEITDLVSEKDDLVNKKIIIAIPIPSTNTNTNSLENKLKDEVFVKENFLEKEKPQDKIYLKSQSPLKINKNEEYLNEIKDEEENENKKIEEKSHILIEKQLTITDEFNTFEANNENYSNLEIIDLKKEEKIEEKLIISESGAKNAEEYLSRYTCIVNNNENKLLSYKRRREEMINESYKAFGFSLDEKDNFKKGLSRVEKEKLIEKEKQNKDQIPQIEKEEINQNQLNLQNKNLQLSIYDKITKIKDNNIKNSLMQDAILKKTRIEIDKEKFLEEQKNQNQNKDKDKENSINININLNLNEEKNLNQNLNQINYLTFKQKKEAILKASNLGKIKKNLFFNFYF